VPNADLILLVGRADDLIFLSAEHLALPGLSDWQITPHRFRVVTTFSFTPPSIRDFTRETGCWGDEEAYRQRLIGQIEGLVTLNTETRDPKLYFPLEFGDTGRGQGSSRKPAGIDDLSVDGAASSRHRGCELPLSRLEGAIAIHGSVMRIHEGKRKALDAQMRNLEKDLERSHGTIRALEKATQAPREMERWTMSIPSDEDISLKNWQLAKDLRAAATKLRTRALGQLDGEEVTAI
jgi:hypothetical protein